MTNAEYWTPAEFASVINISDNYLHSRLCYSTQLRPVRVGHKCIIRKRQFFDWSKNGGKEELDAAFPRRIIAHDNIEKAMTAYYMSFYR